MIPAGYMLKTIVARPDWIKTEKVQAVYSVSNCVSMDFPNYINYWKHNGYWFFNSPKAVIDLVPTDNIDVSSMTMLYYEVYEKQFDESSRNWSIFNPENDFPTAVEEPATKILLGYDVTTYSVGTSHECSPLSCCMLAEQIPTNEHCLLDAFEEAKSALEAGKFDQSEPGPFRILAVYRV